MKTIFLILVALSFGCCAAEATAAGQSACLSDSQRIELNQKYDEISKEIENRPTTLKPNLGQEYIDTEAAQLTAMLNLFSCTQNARFKNLEQSVVCSFEIEQFAKANKTKFLLQNKLKQLPESDIEEEIRRRIEIRSAYPSCK
jgi:hypothetical protein